MTKFDPNKVQRKEDTIEWATYIPSRTPKFKVHILKGQAIAALKYRSYNKDRNYEESWLPQDQQLFCRRFGIAAMGEWEEVELVERYLNEPGACIIKGELK